MIASGLQPPPPPGLEPAPCSRCLKPPSLCVCAAIEPVVTQARVLILQHPREPDRLLGTARLAHLALPGSVLRVGLSWPNLAAALGEGAGLEAGRASGQKARQLREAAVAARGWGVLYLGTWRRPPRSRGARAGEAAQKGELPPLLVLDRLGAASPASAASEVRGLRGLVALDGNWKQAKSLWWRNPWLLKLRRLVLTAPPPSLYGPLRREPRRESLSTLEALAYSLAIIERRPQIVEPLLAPLRALIQAYRAAHGETGTC